MASFPKQQINQKVSDDVDLLVIEHHFFILSLVEAVTVFLFSLCCSFCVFACGEKRQKLSTSGVLFLDFLRERIGNLTGACCTLAVFKGHLVSE